MAAYRHQEKSIAARAALPLLSLGAAYYAYSGLSSLAYFFMGVAIPARGIGGWTAAAAGGLQAIVAVAALTLAARNDLRGVTLAVACSMMLGWLSTLPSVAMQGLDFHGDDRTSSAYFVLSPVIAIVAAALAWRNVYPIAAALIVSAPIVVGLLFIAVLAVAIAMYGF